VNYNDNISDWIRLFGESSVYLRVYDVDALIAKDIRCDFLSVLGIAAFVNDFDFTQTVNTGSVFGDLLKMKIALNRMDYDEPKYRSHVVNHLRALAVEYPEFSAKPFISPTMVDKIREHYREQNKAFFDKHRVENASKFVLSNLSGNRGGPYIDEAYDWRDIPNAENILAELYSRNKDVAELFERGLSESGVSVG
jgi:hypothetical protein